MPRILFKKGGDPRAKLGGRPKGNVSLKSQLKKNLTKEKANLIVSTLIRSAISGSVRHTQLIADLIGDLDYTPNININNNTLTIPEYIIERAREYALGNCKITGSIDRKLIPDVVVTDVVVVEDMKPITLIVDN